MSVPWPLAARAATRPLPHPARPRGVLDPQTAAERFRLARYLASADLAASVEHYWIVEWDLRGQPPHRQETLPSPSVHLVFEHDRSAVYGVMRTRFAYLLRDQGRVFGVRFRPGAFFPLLGAPVWTLTDRRLGAAELFGPAARTVERRVLDQADHLRAVAEVEQFLRPRLMAVDPLVESVASIVQRILADREVVKVSDVARAFDLSPRVLQRLFRDYVGVGPKWVIRQARLLEAAARLDSGAVVDCPRLAIELGYFDQAHFIRDFKRVVGRTPAAYAGRRSARPGV